MRNAECGIRTAALLLLVCGLFSAVSVSSAGESPAGPSQDAIIQTIEGHYRDLGDLTARVVQKNLLSSVGKTQTFEGTLLMKKPGRLRIDYTNGQVIVLDGKNALLYSKKGQQAVKRTFTDIAQANVPVSFLLGAADIRNEFEVVERVSGAVRHTLDLTPKRKDAAMKKIELVCDETGRITAMAVYDRSGNTAELAFLDVRENTGLEDARFVFAIPKGTEIIEQ